MRLSVPGLCARLDRRSALIWAGLFVATLLLAGWPRPRVRRAFSGAYAAVANPALRLLSFGRGGHAALAAGGPTAGPGAAIEEDTRLMLTVAGFEGALPFGLSLRRDAFLPSLVLIAALVGAPLAARRKLLCMGLGVGGVLVLSFACICLTAAWIFASQLQGVYEPDSAWRSLLDLVAGALLLPPGNRFALPLALGAALVFWSVRPPAVAGESPAGPGPRGPSRRKRTRPAGPARSG